MRTLNARDIEKLENTGLANPLLAATLVGDLPDIDGPNGCIALSALDDQCHCGSSCYHESGCGSPDSGCGPQTTCCAESGGCDPNEGGALDGLLAILREAIR